MSDVELAAAPKRFEHAPPATKEAYYYRSVFASLFDHPDAAKQVPGGKSIACSTPTALQWDASFANRADPSGRAVRGVHDDAYEDG